MANPISCFDTTTPQAAAAAAAAEYNDKPYQFSSVQLLRKTDPPAAAAAEYNDKPYQFTSVQFSSILFN